MNQGLVTRIKYEDDEVLMGEGYVTGRHATI